MVNYKYDLDCLEDNHARYVTSGEISFDDSVSSCLEMGDSNVVVISTSVEKFFTRMCVINHTRITRPSLLKVLSLTHVHIQMFILKKILLSSDVTRV